MQKYFPMIFLLYFSAHQALGETKPVSPYAWSIGIVSGNHPLDLTENPVFPNPRFTAADVKGIKGTFVADPFLVLEKKEWLLFFEVMNAESGRGEIGLAKSLDGFQWNYDRIVLKEQFHLSYPFVFKQGNGYYMIPETRASNSVRLYRALDFPHRWKLERVLFEGNYSDSSIVRYHDRWWIFTNQSPYTLDIWSSDQLEGSWKKHPLSPIYREDNTRSRPGGRPVVIDGNIVRFVQDNHEGYGKQLRAFIVDVLDEKRFQEHAAKKDPLWVPRGKTWSVNGVHHLSPVQMPDGSWRAAIDGSGVPEPES